MRNILVPAIILALAASHVVASPFLVNKATELARAYNLPLISLLRILFTVLLRCNALCVAAHAFDRCSKGQ